MPTPADLLRFLETGGWKRPFEKGSLQSGASLRTRATEMSWEQVDPSEHLLTATFCLKGEASLRTEVVLWYTQTEWSLETSCPCETRLYCHHAAAILERVSQPHIFEKLLRGGTLQSGPLSSSPDSASFESSRPEPHAPARLRTSPHFKLELVRLESYPEITQTYLHKHTPTLGAPTLAAASVCYGPYCFPLLAQIQAGGTLTKGPEGENLLVERFPALEREAASQLSQQGLLSVASDPVWKARVTAKKPEWIDESFLYWFPDPAGEAPEACWMRLRHQGLSTLEAFGWSVQSAPDFGYEVTPCDPQGWQFHLHPTQGGWFDLSVGFSVRGKTFDLLPILSHLLKDRFLEETLDRPHHGTQYTVLSDGTALELPIGRVRDILRHLAVFIDPKFPGKASLHALDAVALAQDLPLSAGSLESLAAHQDLYATFHQSQDIAPPEALQATLRGYQTSGVAWMQQLAQLGLSGILADDMGLGKTLQTLAHLLIEKESGRSGGKPSLVVAPTSVTTNWVREARQFAPTLRVVLLQGPQRHRLYSSLAQADLVLTSYALLPREITRLSEYSFHLLVLDEAQYIKNPAAQATRAACQLQAQHRLCLSGTPVENHLGEFWSLFHFLMPGLLGTKEHFNTHYRTPIEKNAQEQKRSELKARVAPLILRRTKDAVAPELPPKTELIHRIELHTEQKDLYETIRATMNKKIRQAVAARGLDASQFFFLSALLKLRQICCHPALLEDHPLKERSSKFQFCLELLETLRLEGRRVLLFSQFTTMLDLFANELKKQAVPFLLLSGATKNRAELVETFQRGEVPIFLISLKAGGTGLTLTAADTVIHYDPWWNPAVERQATDRAYRIGQTKPVFIHKLICQNTVEEKIHTLQQKKGDLADALLSDSAHLRLTPESLQALLEPERT